MRTANLTVNPVQSTLLSIKKNLEGVKLITSNSFVFQQRQVVVQRKQKEQEKRKKKEDKTEAFKSFLKGKTTQAGGVGKGSGILDYIKSFASFVFFGFLLNKLLPYLPKVKTILPALTSLVKALERFADFIGNSIVTFIDSGYKAYDSVRGLTKSIGGEKYQKTFDDFSKHFNTFLNLAIVGGLATTGSGLIPKLLGKAADKGIQQVASNTVRQGANRAARQGAAKITTSGGKVIGEVGKKAAPKLLGKVGRTFGSIAGSSAPIIGPLINFGIRVWSGDNPGRAAAGSIGMGIGQSIGGFLGGSIGGIVGSVVPVVGNLLAGGAGVFIGQLIGGLIGEWIGDSLYDFTTKKNGKVQGRAKGGQITRNGVPVGGKIKRGVRPQKQRLKKPTPKKSNPGRDVGGIKKIEKLFPNPEDPKKKNPLKTLKYAATAYNTIPGIGRLLRAGVEGSFGERPDKNLIRDFSSDIGAIVQNVVNGQINTSNANILAMASGGMVPERTAGLNQMNIGEQVSNLLAKSLDVMMNNQMNRVFQNIMKQYDLEDFGVDAMPPSTDDSTGAMDFDITGEATDPTSGALLIMQAGIPAKSAAYLSGNIMQESGWKGQRAPWVLDDGAGTNKGIISWNRGRIQAAEKFLGKPLEKASNAEQVRWMLHEMQTSYPSSWRVINNEKSTDEEIKDAIYRYIVWGDTGKRWEYSKQAMRGLESRKIDLSSRMNPRILNAPTNELTMMSGGSRPSKYISSEQGMRWGREHKGVDVAGGAWGRGAKLTVIQPGRVVFAGWQDPNNRKLGWGQFVIIRHNNGIYTLYAHLDRINVSQGQTIQVDKDGNGTVIGTLGDTGKSTGPHLHFEIATRYSPVILSGHLDARSHIDKYVTIGGKVVNKNKDKNQFDVLIPLDHVKDKSLIGDPRYPKASLGAEGEERRYQEQAAAQVKANLERSGLRVKIMKPEDYGSYAAYDAFIRKQSAGGAVTVPIHLDAVTSAGGKGALTRVRAGDAGDRALASGINPVLQRFARKHGLSYGGMDTESNRTVNQSGDVGAATLIELGVQAELRRKFGPNFMQSPEVKQLLIDLSNAIRRGVKPKGSGTAARISSVPTSARMQAQSIARYDATTERTTTVVAYQPVIQQQLTPVPVKSRGALFPGDSMSVNTDSRIQSMAVA